MNTPFGIANLWLEGDAITRFVAIVLLLYDLPLFEGLPTRWLGEGFLVLAALLTLWSMGYYLRAAARALRQNSRV